MSRSEAHEPPPGTALAARLERNGRGRDLVVGDIHGHFETLRHALAELEVGEGDRVFSLGDLIDRGPHSIRGARLDRRTMTGARRFNLVRAGEPRADDAGKHSKSTDYAPAGDKSGRNVPMVDSVSLNGGGWWDARKPGHTGHAWIEVLRVRPFCAKVETGHGPVGLVHACPVHASWQELEETIARTDRSGRLTRERALWSRVRHGLVQREIGETGDEHLGPVEGVRCVVTGHTPVPEPVWHENVLGIDTGVHITDRGYGRLTIARIDTLEIETVTFDRVERP